MKKTISNTLFLDDISIKHVNIRDNFDKAHEHLVDLKLTFKASAGIDAKSSFIALLVTDETINALKGKIHDLTKDVRKFTFEQFSVRLLDGINDYIPEMKKELSLTNEFYLASVVIGIEKDKVEPVEGVTHPDIGRIEYCAALEA